MNREHDLVIGRRQASWAVAAALGLIVGAFVVGYVAGKRSMLTAQQTRSILCTDTGKLKSF